MNSNAGRGFLKAIIIVGLIFVVVYFYSYNRWLSHDFNSVDIKYRYDDEKTTSTDTTDNTNTTNNTDVSSEFKSRYNNIKYELFETVLGEEFYDVFYNNAKFSDEFYIFLGVANFIKNDALLNCNYTTEISQKELNDKIISLVGNVSYNDKTFTTKNGHLSINYNDSLKKYTVTLNNKCGGIDFSSGGIKTFFEKAEKDNQYMYIYEKALYMESELDSNGKPVLNQTGTQKFNCYNDVNKSGRIIANTIDDVDKEVLPTYVFKFSISGNTYTLESISKK